MTPNQKKALAAAVFATAIAVPAEGLRQSLPALLASFYKPTGGLIFFRNGAFGAYRRRSCFFKRPSTTCNTVIQNANRNPMHFGNFSPRNALRIHVNNSSVSSLLLTRGPCAVIWIVSNAVVSSLYRKFVGITGGHGPCVERLERRPLLADRNSFASIGQIRFIPASTEHIAPTRVDSRSLHSVRSRARPYCRPRPLASAGNAFSSSKVSANNDSLYPAGTSTEPCGRAIGLISGFSNNYPPVSYTHLDVYKRQTIHSPNFRPDISTSRGFFIAFPVVV